MFSNNSLYVEDITNIINMDLDWDALKDKTLLITGATGLLGTFFIDLLMYKNKISKLNLTIYAIGRNKEIALKRFSNYFKNPLFKFLVMDISKTINLNFPVDYIIHAASNTHPKSYIIDPIGTITSNIFGMYNLLEGCDKKNLKKFIFLSSVEIYGAALNEADIFDEEYSGYINCNSVRAGYPESKRVTEALCNAYIEQYDLNIVIGRLSRLYGPTMRLNDSKAISQFILNGINKENIVLKSKGTQLFSYCYVADAVMGILFLLLKGVKGNVYNIADISTPIMLRNIAEYIADISETKVIFQAPDIVEHKGFSVVPKAVMNCNKIQKLGYKPFYDIKSGLKRTLKILADL